MCLIEWNGDLLYLTSSRLPIRYIGTCVNQTRFLFFFFVFLAGGLLYLEREVCRSYGGRLNIQIQKMLHDKSILLSVCLLIGFYGENTVKQPIEVFDFRQKLTNLPCEINGCTHKYRRLHKKVYCTRNCTNNIVECSLCSASFHDYAYTRT
jgi:hypothetical protein